MKDFIKKIKSVRKFHAVGVFFKRKYTKKVDLNKLKAHQDFHISDRNLLKLLECSTKNEAIEKFRNNFNNIVLFNDHSILIKCTENQKTKIIERAEKCCNNSFYIFNRWVNNVYDESEKHYKWDMDLFANYKFKNGYYTDVRQLNKTEGVDLKVPWELSRMQYLMFLVEAYIITKDEKYSGKVVHIIKDWIFCNPPKMGVNWNCTMDVALRIANMVVAVAAIKDSQVVDNDFIWLFIKTCFKHGIHIRRNMEDVQKQKDNHYLSDVFGLLCLSIHIRFLKIGRKWEKYSIKRIFTEIKRQLYPDGMQYEGSTSYNRLICEIFYFSELICKRVGIKVPSFYISGLQKMAQFTQAILKPNGCIPQIGDNDSGRVYIFTERNNLEHEYLVKLVLSEVHGKSSESYDELCWIYGTNINEATNENSKLKNFEEILCFPHSKIAVYKNKDLYLCQSAIANNFIGMGGHTHNDKLAIELQYKGKDFFIDPGTGVYTSFPDIRNKLRSTQNHNTVVVNGTEQCSFDAKNIFRLDNSLLKTDLQVKKTEERTTITGRHNGYLYEYGIEHMRKIEISKDNHVVIVTDYFSGRPKSLQWNFILSPDVNVRKINDFEVDLFSGDAHIQLKTPFMIQLTDGLYSYGYYCWDKTKILRYELESEFTNLYKTYIVLC